MESCLTLHPPLLLAMFFRPRPSLLLLIGTIVNSYAHISHTPTVVCTCRGGGIGRLDACFLQQAQAARYEESNVTPYLYLTLGREGIGRTISTDGTRHDMAGHGAVWDPRSWLRRPGSSRSMSYVRTSQRTSPYIILISYYPMNLKKTNPYFTQK